MTQHFKIASGDIVHEDFGGDLVVLNLTTGQYFGVNASGAALWTAVVAGQDTVQIGKDLGMPEAVSRFVAQLTDFGLIVPDDDVDRPHTKALSTLPEPPTIEAYDDLADLIVADPIHDVDAEMGWPKRPETS